MPTQRALKDANFHLESYLPAAAASAQTDTLDLKALVGDPDPSLFDIQVVVPALPNHTDTSKTITLTVQDSDDDVTYADTAPAIVCKVAGVASTGSAETTFTFRLPPGVRRYVQLTMTVPSGDGDNSGGLVTIDPLF